MGGVLMARSRNIKPGFFTNDMLAELPALTRLFFIGLWTLVDRDGRIEDRPKKLKAECMPYDDMDADAALDALEKSGFILRYVSGNTRCIQVVNWAKHQNPHIKEQPSSLPAPDKSGASPVQTPDAPLPLPEVARLIPDSLPLIPDSIETPPTPRKRGSAGADGFDEFWSAYPRKTAKPAAMKAFCKLAPSAELLDDLLQAIARQKHWPAWCKDEGQFIPHPATWINGRRWEDQAQAPPAEPYETPKQKAARDRVDEWTGGLLRRQTNAPKDYIDADTRILPALG
jgi:hypothetical protein